MKKTTGRKLSLSKESIRRLGADQLSRAAGAATQYFCEPTVYTCTCPDQCWISYRCETTRCLTPGCPPTRFTCYVC